MDCQRVYVLSLLTLSYVCGELGHFLLGITSRDMARDIGFGDKGCLLRPDYPTQLDPAFPLHLPDCNSGSANQSTCEKVGRHCEWNYSGLGMDYQLLAGPAFVAVFTVSGVIFGTLADFVSRTKILGICVMAFSLSCLMMAFADKYWHLVVLRMILAAGESACHPIGISLISDLFSEKQRGSATGIFMWGIYIGYGLSYCSGVYLTAADLGGLGWRSSYICAGLLGIIIGILIVFLKDVWKQSMVEESLDEQEMISLRVSEKQILSQHPSKDPKVKDKTEKLSGSRTRKTLSAFCKPVVLLLFLAAAFRHTAGFAFAYNNRLYYQIYYPNVDVGTWLSWIPIVGGTAGVFCGGFISDKAVKRLGLPARLWVLGGSLLLASPFALGVMAFPPPMSFGMLLPYYFLSETWISILYVVLVQLVPDDVKTSFIAVFAFLKNNVGGNFPVFLDPLAKSIGYREAIIIFFPGFVAASSSIFLLASIPLKRSRGISV